MRFVVCCVVLCCVGTEYCSYVVCPTLLTVSFVLVVVVVGTRGVKPIEPTILLGSRYASQYYTVSEFSRFTYYYAKVTIDGFQIVRSIGAIRTGHLSEGQGSNELENENNENRDSKGQRTSFGSQPTQFARRRFYCTMALQYVQYKRVKNVNKSTVGTVDVRKSPWQDWSLDARRAFRLGYRKQIKKAVRVLISYTDFK